MKLNLEVLRQILPDAEYFGLGGDEVFERFNIAHLKQFEHQEFRGYTLYFCVYEDNPDQEGWYKTPFDRSANIPRVNADREIVFMIDRRVFQEQLVGCKYIRVVNIFRAIDALRQFVLEQVNPRVVGVTGSVGKTTCAALIQDVVSKKFGCGRIYSKRLTPLTLSSWLVNFLDSAHEVLALEYSMYRRNHIDVLTDMLKPDVGIFLNVRRMHLGVEGINSLPDIIAGKEALIRKSQTALLNLDEPLILELRRKSDLGFSQINPKADAFITDQGDRVKLVLNHIGQTVYFRPYVRTSLLYYQACAAGLVGSILGIPSESIAEALENFTPAEHRITWVDVSGEQVLFDGDVTNSARMALLSDHHYLNSILLIHSFDFGDENVDLQAADFSSVFAKFDEVRVLESEENRTVVSKYSLKNLLFVRKDRFFSGISDYQFKVLHFGIYFRKHKDLGFLKNFMDS